MSRLLLLVAGHVIIEDRVNFGGGAMVQQFARIGEGAMLSGLVGIARSVLPWNTVLEGGVARALNIVGMSRAGLSKESSDAIKWVFRVVHRRDLAPRAALEVLRERADVPEVAHAIEIIETAKRGIASTRYLRSCCWRRRRSSRRLPCATRSCSRLRA